MPFEKLNELLNRRETKKKTPERAKWRDNQTGSLSRQGERETVRVTDRRGEYDAKLGNPKSDPQAKESLKELKGIAAVERLQGRRRRA